MATRTSEAAALTEAYRVAANRRAAQVSAFVLTYWRTRVNVEDPRSVQRWLDLMVPRIMQEYRLGGRLGQTFYDEVRRLEVPGAPAFTALPPKGVLEGAIRASLAITGPRAVMAKVDKADKMGMSDASRAMVLRKAMQDAQTTILGATVRHSLAGGRDVIQRSSGADPVALGWVRVTKADPCYFCAMLASRGLETYGEDSFADSDPRFQGPGDAKVHDHCGCSMKPVYDRADEALTRSAEFERMWREYSKGSSAAAIKSFRQGYEGR